MYGAYPRRGGGSGFLLAIYLLFAAYFMNYALSFVKLPASVDPFNKWIFLVGGILLVIGGINILRLNRYRRIYGF